MDEVWDDTYDDDPSNSPLHVHTVRSHLNKDPYRRLLGGVMQEDYQRPGLRLVGDGELGTG